MPHATNHDVSVHQRLSRQILKKMSGGGKIKDKVAYFGTNIENMEDIRTHFTHIYPRLVYFIDFLKFYISVLLQKLVTFLHDYGSATTYGTRTLLSC